ncbi:rhodanese-like domain-containing protein [Desulfovibrionales bacterium]
MPKVTNLFPGDFEEYQSTRHEHEYILLDVRQPAEYAEAHIPGAVLMPLPELESNCANLDAAKDVILYCRTGGRSAVAAALLDDTGPRAGRIFNLVGGITGWQGKELLDIPHLELFPRDMTLVQTLYRALNVEKGSVLFYQGLACEYAGSTFGAMAQELVQVGTTHARDVFSIWTAQGKSIQHEPFQALFDRLDGNIMEGGKPVTAWMAQLGANAQDRQLRLLELACEIEYYSYDLYRGLLCRSQTPEITAVFTRLAQQKKEHFRSLSRALSFVMS